MDISHPTPPKVKQLSREELFSIRRQASIAAEDARGGNPEAITTLEGLLEFVIQRELSCRIAKRISGREGQRKKTEKKGESSPNEAAIVRRAIEEFVDSDLDWEDMVAVMKEEIREYPEEYTVSEKSTLLKILETNRTVIEVIAQIPVPPPE